MNKYLNNIIKGLLMVLVITIVVGIITLNFKLNHSSMVLISSSLANSIKTETSSDNKNIVARIANAIFNKDEEKEEKQEEKKEETEIKEDIKEETEEVKEEVEVIEETPTIEEPVVVEENTQTNYQEPKQVEPVGEYQPTTDTSNSEVFATYTGLVTAYGPDCVGCGGYTATGYNVSNGNIYYYHPDYGNIRIVAGDRSILRRIVRITGLNISSEPVIAIVLDTGGDIGFNKPKGIILDLLFTSESSPEVYNFGMQWATVEVIG